MDQINKFRRSGACLIKSPENSSPVKKVNNPPRTKNNIATPRVTTIDNLSRDAFD